MPDAPHLGPARRAVLAAGVALVVLTGCAGPADQGGGVQPGAAESLPDAEGEAAEPTPPPTTPPADCPFVAPSELPDGGAPGEATATEDGSGREWGLAPNRVTQYAGEGAEALAGDADAFDESTWEPGTQVVDGGGEQRFVRPVNEFGVGQVQMLFNRDGCAYLTFFPAGIDELASVTYAERF